MKLFLAIFLPFLVFFSIDKPISGTLYLILQITLVAWIIAAMWALYTISKQATDEKIISLAIH
jgi:uncharacterized membrane protein YqaE (UPF0057 family)